ncbi:hypothetical protein [Streptomyces sp. AS58]|uniref:hypothetical protein n=1 Tax=Streptomyces sp. AS58 TaxID=1519489 RepID=UPI001F1AF9CB|nr:hypothetical protein [Streptomyces sp. AS58]
MAERLAMLPGRLASWSVTAFTKGGGEGASIPITVTEGVSMDFRQLDPACVKRILEREVSLRDIRYIAQVEVDPAALEYRWGSPEVVSDYLAEWVCFAFSPGEGQAFFLQREVHHPPAPGFILSVTRGLFFTEAAELIVRALGIAGARVVRMTEEAWPG